MVVRDFRYDEDILPARNLQAAVQLWISSVRVIAFHISASTEDVTSGKAFFSGSCRMHLTAANVFCRFVVLIEDFAEHCQR